jgi:hypothetical protein
MRLLISLFFLIIINWSFTQDTTKIGKDFVIKKNDKIIQKEFYSSKYSIKISYEYNEVGILVRRIWYEEGKIIGISLEN